MGIKMLIKEACGIAYAGQAVNASAAVGETIEVESKDDAFSLARMGRAYFLQKDADPTKGLLTATKEEIEHVQRLAKAIESAKKEREFERYLQSPMGQIDVLSEKVAKLMLAGQAAKPAA